MDRPLRPLFKFLCSILFTHQVRYVTGDNGLKKITKFCVHHIWLVPWTLSLDGREIFVNASTTGHRCRPRAAARSYSRSTSHMLVDGRTAFAICGSGGPLSMADWGSQPQLLLWASFSSPGLGFNGAQMIYYLMFRHIQTTKIAKIQ